MAAKKRAGRKKRRWGWKIALALLLLLALGLGGLYAAGRVVHVRYATVFLRDLPSAFEGTTILFVSDIDAHSAQDARAAAKMMDALDAGAEDFNAEEEYFEIITAPDDFSKVNEALEEKKYQMSSAEITMIPQNYIKLEDPEDIKFMEKLLEMLEDNDDVQNVWHNWEEPEE